MEQINKNIKFPRLCKKCGRPMEGNPHGNKKMHVSCALMKRN